MLYVFDWDGTLMDSTDKIVTCVSSAIKELGLPYRDKQVIKEVIGLALPEAVRQLYADIDDVQFEALREGSARHFVKADEVPCSLYPDVEKVLAALREQGHSLAIATGKGRQGLTRVLEGLGWQDYFDASRCADETRSKPHPLMLHEILDELSFAPSDAVMVGDTEFDLAMASNANMSCVGVSYGAHPVARLENHSPALLIDRFVDLLEYEH